MHVYVALSVTLVSITSKDKANAVKFLFRRRLLPTGFARYSRWIKKTNVSWKNMSAWPVMWVLSSYDFVIALNLNALILILSSFLNSCWSGFDEPCHGFKAASQTTPWLVSSVSLRNTAHTAASTSLHVLNRKPSLRQISTLCRQSCVSPTAQLTCLQRAKWFQ